MSHRCRRRSKGKPKPRIGFQTRTAFGWEEPAEMPGDLPDDDDEGFEEGDDPDVGFEDRFDVVDEHDGEDFGMAEEMREGDCDHGLEDCDDGLALNSVKFSIDGHFGMAFIVLLAVASALLTAAMLGIAR